MRRLSRTLSFVLFLFLAFIVGIKYQQNTSKKSNSAEEVQMAHISPIVQLYHCSLDSMLQVKYIDADFARIKLIVQEDTVLNFSAMRVVSASGAKYNDCNSGYVFWNKGNTASIFKNEKSVVVLNCNTSN